MSNINTIKLPSDNRIEDLEELSENELTKITGGRTRDLKYTVTIPSIAPTIEADVTAKLIGDGGKLSAGLRFK